MLIECINSFTQVEEIEEDVKVIIEPIVDQISSIYNKL